NFFRSRRRYSVRRIAITRKHRPRTARSRERDRELDELERAPRQHTLGSLDRHWRWLRGRVLGAGIRSHRRRLSYPRMKSRRRGCVPAGLLTAMLSVTSAVARDSDQHTFSLGVERLYGITYTSETVKAPGGDV